MPRSPADDSPAAMHKLELPKPDGRSMTLYARTPVVVCGEAPAPLGERGRANPHLRWHPLRAEWVAYAPSRQDRTFLPPPEYDPLAPTVDARNPTEVPAGNWEIAVFENRFPTLVADPPEPVASVVPTAPGKGACEVVVFTQDARGSLGGLPLERIELLLEVWADRTRQIYERGGIRCVMPFENRGVEVGATLEHPHGQIYAYPFVPPVIAREHESQTAHFQRDGRVLLVDHVAAEVEDGRRVVALEPDAVAFVPAFARYAYELWVAPRAWVPSLEALTGGQRTALARVLKEALLRLDGLWQRPMPYVLVVHQAPTDDELHPEWQLHVEICPPYRTATKLKFLAGTELGAGTFASDVLPEEKAAELRAVAVTLD